LNTLYNLLVMRSALRVRRLALFGLKPRHDYRGVTDFEFKPYVHL